MIKKKKSVMISAGRHIEKTLLARIPEEKANIASRTRQNFI